MRPNSRTIRFLAVLATLSSLAANAEVLDKTMKVAETTVHYKVVLPRNYDPAKTYPAILAFGGGPQTMNTVDSVLARNFREEAEKRGYIVVAPAAPDGDLFFEGGERIFPEFLKQILAAYKIENNKFHIAGPSNGGITSLYVASIHPEYFVSITAFPGYLWDETPERVQALAHMCINMFVGELDPMGWQDMMRRQASEFRKEGAAAQFTLEKGQPHRLETLAGPNAARLFDLFDQARRGCGN